MNPDILRLLPQQPPFVLIDALLQADDTVLRSSFTIPADHVLVEDGRLGEAGLVENMAQTAAAGTGQKAQAEGREAPVGYIGALKNLVVTERPPAGTTIVTEIRVLHQVMQASIVQGTVWQDEKEIASCELKIFIQ